jgi:hypothetical protein
MKRFIIEEAGPDSDGIQEIRRMNRYYHYEASCQGRCRTGGKREEHIHDRKGPDPNGASSERMKLSSKSLPPRHAVEFHVVVVATGGGRNMLPK